MIFALTLIPIMGLVGAAVDYSRANSARSALQAAVDATALAMSKNAGNLTEQQLQTKAQQYLEALFNRPEAEDIQVAAVYSQENGTTLKVTARAQIPTTFLGVMGLSSIDIATAATSAWGNVKLRVALVLDNTGSMADAGKMDALKRASHQLLDTLQDAASKKGDVQVAIVPFSKSVNVGSVNRDAFWLDWTDWDAANGEEEEVCTGRGRHGRDCTKQWVPDDHNTWNGCVTDRDQDDDTKNTTPTSSRARFPAEQYNSCPAQITPLSDDFWALDRAIDDMQPVGNTNQTIGLAWGWQALSEGAPLYPPALEPNTEQAIILLTDGMNTENRWTKSQSKIDDRMRQACSNAKAAGIRIYTVLVMDGNASLLRDCASGTENFFALSSSNQIGDAFVQIGTSLTRLRIAR